MYSKVVLGNISDPLVWRHQQDLLLERCHQLSSEEGMLGFDTDDNQFDEEGSVPQQDDDRTLGLLVAVLVSKKTTKEA